MMVDFCMAFIYMLMLILMTLNLTLTLKMFVRIVLLVFSSDFIWCFCLFSFVVSVLLFAASFWRGMRLQNWICLPSVYVSILYCPRVCVCVCVCVLLLFLHPGIISVDDWALKIKYLYMSQVF